MKILLLSAVGLVAINIGDFLCALKQINLLVLQVSHVVLSKVNKEITKYFSICQLFSHFFFFHENFVNLDPVFGVSDESGTYNDLKSYDLLI